MSRAERLLQLMQNLRRRRFPVSGLELAAETGVSLRTLYRDIASLQAQGACIESSPGLGYVLRPGFVLPPMMFTSEEIEALVLGTRWVAERTDSSLGEAAQHVLAKIAAVLPQALRHELESSALFVGPGDLINGVNPQLAPIRLAIRSERKLNIVYQDLREQETERTIWPFAVGFFEHARVVAAWCELRSGFRHFRTDRISRLDVLETPYPRRRQALLKEWRVAQDLSDR